MGSLSRFYSTARRANGDEARPGEAAPGVPSQPDAGASRIGAGSSWPNSDGTPGLDSKGLPPSMNTLGELVAGIVKKAGSEK